MEIINKILEWPVIIQGIFGSFLFWAIFTLGEKAIQFSSVRFKADNDLGKSFAKNATKAYSLNAYNLSNYNFFICIYAAIHYFLKFIIIVFISYLIQEFIPVIAYVGYFISFYFIFRSISYVPHFVSFYTEEEKILNKKLDKEAIEKAKKK